MRVRSVLSTLGVGLMLVVGLDYVAYGATGHSLVLGKVNTSAKTTTVKRTKPGPALTLKVRPGSAPLKVSSKGKVARLNADLLDGLDSSALLERVTGFEPPDSACAGLTPVTTTYQKIADVGTFSTRPATRWTRIDFSTTWTADLGSASSVAFELRVDDTATTLGRAVQLAKEDDLDDFATLTGVFEGLTPGAHTLSVWSRSTGANATEARLDSGCSSLAGNVYVTESR